MDKLIKKCLIQFEKERDINDVFGIPESLPVVDDFISENRLDKDIFDGKNVLFIQHCLAPIVKRIEAMKKHGKFNPDNCWFVDIPYSTSDEIRNEIKYRWKKIKFAPEFNDALKPYTKAQHSRVKQTLEKIADTKGDLLIVDDGAYAIRTLMELGEDNDMVKKLCDRRISIVEQTTRGHRYFTDESTSEVHNDFLIKNNISLVSIAKTLTKKHLESPFIGAAVSSRMIKAIKKFNGGKKLEKILVIGFGPVGKATTEEIIKTGLAKQIDVSEKNSSLKSEIEDIFPPNVDYNVLPELENSSFNTDSKYDAIIGCTGYSSFHPKNVELLNDHAILASSSSATVEFNRFDFLEKLTDSDSGFTLDNKKDIIRDGIHSPITFRKDDKYFTFLNAGYPVNFDGSIESLPYWAIQMTHCLLIAASQEAIKQTKAGKFGFKKLNLYDDFWIFLNSLKHLRDHLQDQGINS